MALDCEQMRQHQRVPGLAEPIHARANRKRQPTVPARRWLFPLWMGVVYLVGMVLVWGTNSPFPVNTRWVVVFSGLLLLHALFYASSAPGKMDRLHQILYLVTQSFLTVLTGFFSMYFYVVVGLYVALTIELVHGLAPPRSLDVSFRNWARRGAMSVLIAVCLFAVNTGFSAAWPAWPSLADRMQLAPRLHDLPSPLTSIAWRPFLIGLSEVVPCLLLVAGYVALFLRQARAQERAQLLLDELQVAHTQVTHYAARVETLTRAAERQRLARELHDTLAQGLIGLTMQLEAVDLHLNHQRNERAQEVVRSAMTRTRALMRDAREAIDELRAQAAASQEFSATIEQEILHFTVTTGIACTPNLEALALIPATLQDTVLCVLREGLTNVARHAHAHQVWIGVVECAGWLEMEVRDDGMGFDHEAVAPLSSGHYGLLGLRERARLAGGSLSIRSTPGTGTILHIRLPKSAEEDQHA